MLIHVKNLLRSKIVSLDGGILGWIIDNRIWMLGAEFFQISWYRKFTTSWSNSWRSLKVVVNGNVW